MFEKEAKEYAADFEKEFHTSYGACLHTFQDAAEFGYKIGKAELEEVTARLEKQKEINKELVDLQEELKEKLAGAERTRDNLRQIGFPTFQSCKEYADKMNYAKTIIKDLLDNSDEYARQRAIVFLKE